MSTALISGVIRQKAQDLFFSSTRFALWFHQNQGNFYVYSTRSGNGRVMCIHTLTDRLHHILYDNIIIRIYYINSLQISQIKNYTIHITILSWEKLLLASFCFYYHLVLLRRHLLCPLTLIRE